MEGSKPQGLSDIRNKAVILLKDGFANEKRLFPFQEPPGGVDISKKLLLNKWYHILIMILLNETPFY